MHSRLPRVLMRRSTRFTRTWMSARTIQLVLFFMLTAVMGQESSNELTSEVIGATPLRNPSNMEHNGSSSGETVNEIILPIAIGMEKMERVGGGVENDTVEDGVSGQAIDKFNDTDGDPIADDEETISPISFAVDHTEGSITGSSSTDMISTGSIEVKEIELDDLIQDPKVETNAKQVVVKNSSSFANNDVRTSPDSIETDEPEPTAVLEMHGVPSNPTMVTAVAFDGRAEVSWKTPDDDGLDPITGYEVGWIDEVDDTLVGTQVVAQIASSLTAANDVSSSSSASTDIKQSIPTTTVVTQLANGRSYTFKVRAKNKNGYSVWSAKSLAVSPLHPPDLCGRLSCSGHGTCFPNYHPNREKRLKKKQRGLISTDAMDKEVMEASSSDAQCICRPGYSPPDCSVKDEDIQYVWKVSGWSECSSGCGGGQRTRTATCYDIVEDTQAPAEMFCTDKKPSLTGICNGMECGSKLVSVLYEVEMSYDEVLFTPESIDAFDLAFTTEVAAALQIPQTRIEITALKRGSIAVYFQILPASRVGEISLNEIVERLQDQLSNSSSELRSKGTFARRIEPNGVKVGFSIADQTVADGAEDISILGLIGTVMVLCFFVSSFGWFLRRRHHRIMKHSPQNEPDRVINASRSDMKRMGIRTMA